MSTLENRELDALEDRLTRNEIDMTQYSIQKRRVETKYRYN